MHETDIFWSVSVAIELGGATHARRSMTVTEYLDMLDIDVCSVAVGFNLEFIPRGKFSQFRLCDGDRIRIVRFAGAE